MIIILNDGLSITISPNKWWTLNNIEPSLQNRRNPENKSVACGMLEFKELEEAEKVHKKLNGRKIADHDGRISAIMGYEFTRTTLR
jgi:hypothetical protein